MIRSESVKIIIPFRLREGADPRRAANLDIVQAWWYAHGYEPVIVDDGREGNDQFNRHKAYNRAVSRNPAEVYVFTEADMLIHPDQIKVAVEQAIQKPGIVVPFTQYRYLSDSMTEVLRDDYRDSSSESTAAFWSRPVSEGGIFALTPEFTMDEGRSIGAINVITRETLDITGGFTEATSGNWYDDNITEEGFAFLCRQKTRFVPGPAVHMYHLPGHKGDHLTDEDRRATAHNRTLLTTMRRNIRTRQHASVRRLMQHRSAR